MDFKQLDELLTLLRKHDVLLYKTDALAIQLNPKLPAFNEPEITDNVPGGWKRGPDLME